MARVGLDLGGTKIAGVLLGEDGVVRDRRRIPTPAAEGYERVLDDLAGLGQALIQKKNKVLQTHLLLR